MNILGIETSCDETSAAVVRNGRVVLSNIVTSSLKEHRKYGGIIPEIASRRQLECINPAVSEALHKAGLGMKNIDAVAVTSHPGLIGSLLVGVSYARALSYAQNKTLIEVDHIQAHLYANCLTVDKPMPKLPALGLVVSGGHSSLFYIKSFKNYQLLGQTRDDAAGEAFDKVARLLGLEYPGGPVIDRIAKTGSQSRIKFSCAEFPDSYDFSFSGIKTAGLYYKKNHEKDTDFSLPNVAFAFQDSITNVLVKKCIDACRKKRIKSLLIGGGVAANSALRTKLSRAAEENKLDVYFPPMQLCLDNAAMIAGLAYQLSKKPSLPRLWRGLRRGREESLCKIRRSKSPLKSF